MSNPPKKSIFRTLPKRLADKERKAAIRHRKSLDGICTVVYSNFFNLTRIEQDIALALAEPKKMGRSIK